ncbi:phage tail spike protein [Carnobacterium viridans]|uniref:phage tail spike protein n=1 Tax=Carnobacterium viridans TaxID=174587 RepID=UPI00115FDF19|nr:phage tail spike protein [Carnobacterium viridans]
MVNRWSGEIIINGYDIRLVSRLGKDTDALLYEKKNITDFVDKESIQGIVTRVHGKSEWTEDGPDGKQLTKRIKTTVDSPLINAYSGIVFEQQFTNNDIRTEQELKNWLTLKFSTENIDKPSRTIELDTNIVDETEVALGDKLNLKYLKHDVDMLIRMTKYQYDGFNNRYIKSLSGMP